MLKSGGGSKGLSSLLEEVLGQLLGTTQNSVLSGSLNGKSTLKLNYKQEIFLIAREGLNCSLFAALKSGPFYLDVLIDMKVVFKGPII